jgi:hypothetical protein
VARRRTDGYRHWDGERQKPMPLPQARHRAYVKANPKRSMWPKSVTRRVVQFGTGKRYK